MAFGGTLGEKECFFPKELGERTLSEVARRHGRPDLESSLGGVNGTGGKGD